MTLNKITNNTYSPDLFDDVIDRVNTMIVDHVDASTNNPSHTDAPSEYAVREAINSVTSLTNDTLPNGDDTSLTGSTPLSPTKAASQEQVRDAVHNLVKVTPICESGDEVAELTVEGVPYKLYAPSATVSITGYNVYDSVLSIVPNSKTIPTGGAIAMKLESYVPKVEGWGLSQNDFDDAAKNKLDAIVANANYVEVDSKYTDGNLIAEIKVTNTDAAPVTQKIYAPHELPEIPAASSAGKVLGVKTDGSIDWIANTATVTVDQVLSDTSNNPVANHIILEALDKKIESPTLTATDAGLVLTVNDTGDGFILGSPSGSGAGTVKKVGGASPDSSGNVTSIPQSAITGLSTALSSKQDALVASQLNAVNSGITAAKVADYDAYATSKANDSDVVHKTGTESIAGQKTFTDSCTFDAMITADEVDAQTLYIDGTDIKTILASKDEVVKLTGDQTITGTKTFSAIKVQSLEVDGTDIGRELENKVAKTTKVNGKVLSADITLTGEDIAISSTDNTTIASALADAGKIDVVALPDGDLTISSKKVTVPKATDTAYGVVKVDNAVVVGSTNPVSGAGIAQYIDNEITDKVDTTDVSTFAVATASTDATGIAKVAGAKSFAEEIEKKLTEPAKQTTGAYAGHNVLSQYDIEDVYDKTEIDTMLTGAYVVKGTVADMAALNAVANPQNGWIYTVSNDGTNTDIQYVYVQGTGWQAQGGLTTLTNYYTKTAADGKFATQTTTVNTKPLSGDITLTGSDIAITGYTKGTAATLAASDSVNTALGKLEASLDEKATKVKLATDTTEYEATAGVITLPAAAIDKYGVVKLDSTAIHTTSDPKVATNVMSAKAVEDSLFLRVVNGKIDAASSANAIASADYAVAIGNSSKALGYGSFAIGSENEAQDSGTFAGGFQSTASDDNAFAFGNQAVASGECSVAMGGGATATGNYSAAFGSSTANDEGAFACGLNNTAELIGSFAAGKDNNVNGNYSAAFGESNIVNGSYSFAAGKNVIVNNEGAHAEGKGLNTYETTIANTLTAVNDASTAAALGITIDALADNNTVATNLYTCLANTDVKVPVIAFGQASHAEGADTIALGQCTHTEGLNTVASNKASHAEGMTTVAMGIGAHSEGTNSFANGKAAHAEGNSYAGADFAHGEGSGEANANYSHAEGKDTSVDGEGAHAEGENTKATKARSHAEGYKTTASGDNAHAEGYNTVASGESSHAEGNATATGKMAHAEGGATAQGVSSHAEGYSITIGNSSHAECYSTRAVGAYSHAEGSYAETYGVGSHAEGGMDEADAQDIMDWLSNLHEQYITEGLDPDNSSAISEIPDYNIDDGNLIKNLIRYHRENNPTAGRDIHFTYGPYSHVEGSSNITCGAAAHAEGAETSALGDSSHTEGMWTNAYGHCSHAEGNATIAAGQNSHAEGSNTTASGENSHAGGYNSIANKSCAFAHGSGATASGTYALALGENTIASGARSIAFGNASQAKAGNAFAGGTRCIAYGTNDFVYGSESTAYGDRAISIGLGCVVGDYTNTVKANNSFALGNHAQALNNDEIALGRYNLSRYGNGATGTKFTIGAAYGAENATNNVRKNIIEICNNGNIYAKGLGGYDGTNGATTGVNDLATVINAKANVWTGTQAEYNAIAAPDANTLYIIL